LKAEIYTSAYWNRKVKEMVDEGKAVAVGITLYPNKKDYGYRLVDRILELAPSRSIFSVDDLESFEPLFRNRLKATWPFAKRRLEKIVEVYPDKALILLCFDKVGPLPKDWCHRTIVGDFISEMTGQRVPELGMMASQPIGIQGSFFSGRSFGSEVPNNRP
jgi:hypothetical protein